MAENQIIVYQPNETVRLDVWLANETVWLNQSRIGELFGVDRTVVNRHIHNIYKTGELDEPSTCAKIAQVQKEGGRSITRQLPFYNLDMIIAVGYRVNSFAATQFRKWATTILREYLLRGYAFNQHIDFGTSYERIEEYGLKAALGVEGCSVETSNYAVSNGVFTLFFPADICYPGSTFFSLSVKDYSR